MIVHVAKSGKDAAGFTRYLFGPGKANEHTNPHMITGSTNLASEWAGANLSMAEATHLGRVVEAAWRRQYAPDAALAGVGAGGISRESLHSEIDKAIAGGAVDGTVVPKLGPQQDHVFHAVLALKPTEGKFTDEQWSQLAETYMRELGFTGADDRTDASWYAVHHGLSKDGNDHIHIVACTTRPDGTRVDLHNSGRRSQTIRREVLEKFDFVTPLHEAQRAQATPTVTGYTASEANIARDLHARGQRDTATPDRVLLQRILRAAAVEARTEAGFINNVLQNARAEVVDGKATGKAIGLEIEATRWQAGTNKQVVSGYKVRFRDGVWFSASNLSPDLTLSKFRKEWTGENDASRSYARALWAEQALPERRTVTPPDAARSHLDQAADELALANDAIERLDPHDTPAWNDVEAATAGATAVVATARPVGFRVEAGRASDALTRQWLADSYNQPAGAIPQVPAGLSGLEVATRHIQLAVRATSTDRHQGWLAVIQQMNRTIEAIARAKAARSEAIAAATLRHDAVTAMQRLEDWLGARVQPDSAPDVAMAPQQPATELSEAAQRALEGSSHGRVTDQERRAAATQPTGTDARVNRGPEPRHGQRPRRR